RDASGGDSCLGHERVAANGEGLDAIALYFEAAADRGWHDDLAFGADGDSGFDDVLRPVTAGSGDVTGKREVGQRGEGDVVGAADSGLEHAAAPDGDSPFGGGVVNAYRLAEAADAADLDVDDAAGFHIDGGEGVAAVADGFVETDVGFEAFLEHGVEVEVVVPERLLDHEQVEFVPACDVVEVLHAIGGVGVAAQGDVGPAVADGLEDFGVPAGLALELDALIAGG